MPIAARVEERKPTLTLEQKFDKLAALIRTLPKEGPIQLSAPEKLSFYSLHKQATCGPCVKSGVPKPSLFQVEARLKWSAWKDRGAMSKEDAMERYLGDMSKLKKFRSHKRLQPGIITEKEVMTLKMINEEIFDNKYMDPSELSDEEADKLKSLNKTMKIFDEKNFIE